MNQENARESFFGIETLPPIYETPNIDSKFKTRAKLTFDIFTNLILPAIDECTDLYSGLRFLL